MHGAVWKSCQTADVNNVPQSGTSFFGSITQRCSGYEPTLPWSLIEESPPKKGRKAGPEGAVEIEPTKIIFETQSEYNNKGPSKSRQPAKFDAYVKRIDQNSLPTFSPKLTTL